ncbi:L-rhamnose mutarotase [Paenibacillus psychroresistens]|uniref:L-rhamnose mutarotase n=1 Tax=Paenibacillus psychroresistens TaxID=1778678 RepID=A0A6B8RI23_9BACL|nr:L-rhamnose mutarotase [Paenibacillus psychroresistens]QGQ95202.1 L-rhamnose mutarotase [Paenibacillus psychroresistens]
MARSSFVLRISPADYETYVDRHRHVYPDLLAAFGEAGITSYSIYYYEGLLFAYMEAEDFAYVSKVLSSHPASHRWAAFMSDILLCWENGNDSVQIEEVFHYAHQDQ